ncbi:MAG: hypothetical protein QOF02_2911 [Blastocatellia bacterium]|jgi:hypothetical protein|nr:hypothetical protein [Blastocatellia bacterium]
MVKALRRPESRRSALRPNCTQRAAPRAEGRSRGLAFKGLACQLRLASRSAAPRFSRAILPSTLKTGVLWQGQHQRHTKTRALPKVLTANPAPPAPRACSKQTKLNSQSSYARPRPARCSIIESAPVGQSVSVSDRRCVTRVCFVLSGLALLDNVKLASVRVTESDAHVQLRLRLRSGFTPFFARFVAGINLALTGTANSASRCK